MVKIALQIKATFENVEKLSTNHPDFNFFLKLKCLNCGEQSDKWHDITESVTTETARSATNYQAKCKLCARENSMDILPGSNGDYTADDQGKFKTIVIFDCRGLEPIEFSPRDGWIVKIEESNKIFEDVDLTEKEWVEYDEKIKQSVGIYEFESQFIKVK